jgi:hypothetical protein
LGGSAPKLPRQNFARKLRLINIFFVNLVWPSLSLYGEVLLLVLWSGFLKTILVIIFV